MNTPHMDDLRNVLMETLKDLRNRDKPMEVERARAVAQVAAVVVDTARVEVSYINTVGGKASSEFIKQRANAPAIPSGQPGRAHAPFGTLTQQHP